MSDQATQRGSGSDTRERILSVALDLFIRKGYAETSLREIAAELGITKAALYYHFPAKSDILLALHLRVHGLTDRLAPALPADGVAGEAAWAQLVDQLLAVALANRRLVELHLRNQEAIRELHSGEQLARHGVVEDGGLEARFMEFLADRSTPADMRVRRVATLGMIAGVLVGATAVSDVSDDDLERQLRSLIGGVLASG